MTVRFVGAATGLPKNAPKQLAAQAKALTGWLTEQGYDTLHFELPLQETSPDGSETNAILDCLAEGPAGLLILDHKSGLCPVPTERFASYLPQLSAYATLVRRKWPGKPLNGVAIYWMSEGSLSIAQLQADVSV